eukprot:GEMP01051699.1.p1 GENE.GEMP01051699.1~~GEMP01051699.1.p1  ORF type:complete len:445 (+),score=71.70 GEMP01051699.1:191-1525(+)
MSPPAHFAPLKVSFYELVLRQLQDDGFHEVADQLVARTNLQPELMGAENRLFDMYKNTCGQSQSDSNGTWKRLPVAPMPPIGPNEQHLNMLKRPHDDSSSAKNDGGDGVFPSTQLIASRTVFQAVHKGMVRSVKFSPDGRFVATGSADCSVKVFECTKMRSVGMQEIGKDKDDLSMRPVVRSFIDHQGVVSATAFHPTKPSLITGAYDKTVKIWDLSKPSSQMKAQAVIGDVHPIRCLEIHPSGDFLYVGTSHSVIRLYDLATLNCFTAFQVGDHHTGAVNDIRCTSDGRVAASAGQDGTVKLWDAVSNRVINTLENPHGGTPVTSIRWSRNLRYLVTSGCDGRCRMWDSRTGAVLFAFGIGPRACDYSRTTFCCNEKYIAVANTNHQISDVAIFDAATGSPLTARLNAHDGAGVMQIDGSPVDDTLVTGSDDNKFRYMDLERI